ncbi:MAG: M12 family metallo-peptidase, partial [Saprospiraceae bacterium]
MLLFTLSLLYGQKPVALQAIALFSGNTPTVYTPFMQAAQAKESTPALIREGFSMQLKSGVLSEIKQKAPSIFTLHLDYPFHIDLDLFRVNIYSPASRILTSDGRSADPNRNHFFYRGIIHGKTNSLVTVSILDDYVIILYADENGNHRIQPSPDGGYIAFADHDVLVPPQIECHVDDADAGITTQNHSSNRTTGNCIEVYIEADYKSYQDNGSNVATTEAWVAGLWNEVITLYENEAIPVTLSDIFVYTSTDPYAGMTTTLAILNAFSTHIDTLTYDGRLAHFMTTRNVGGGIAWLNVLCSTISPCAVSTALSTTIVGFPTYSWSVMVLTHEMGHNIGSRHTHACVWNGNNTQIDDCGNQWAINNNQNPEGAACFDPNNPILPDAGTIMSYCHAIGGVGIDFNLGFGPLPGNLIRNNYNNANCNTGVCSPPSCTHLSTPLNGAIDVESCDNLTWTGIVGVSGYRLTIGTTPNGGEIVNNLDVGMATTYNPVSDLPFSANLFVKIIPYNDAGDATGCVNEIFTVEPNIPPLCTSLTNPPPGDLNCPLTAVMRWTHSIGAQTGYKITMGTTPTGTDIANNVDVGNVPSYDPPGLLPPGSTIYVKITPYGILGDNLLCTSQTFATAPPIDGDFCNIAINLACGASIQGSTLNAYADSDAITCGVT